LAIFLKLPLPRNTQKHIKQQRNKNKEQAVPELLSKKKTSALAKGRPKQNR
jgi:hypothetical protein